MENSAVEELILDLTERCKSVEIRKNVYMDGDTQKTEYVAIGRIDRGMSRGTGTTLLAALNHLDAKAD